MTTEPTINFAGLTASQKLCRGHEMLNACRSSVLLNGFKPRSFPPRRERLAMRLREIKRRLRDAWRVLAHGAEVDPW